MQIGALIRRAALYYRDAPCLIEGERIVSFQQFDELTDRLGNALITAGLRPGDRVGVLLPNGIDCLIAYYALAKAGLVRVALNPRETAADHAWKLTDSTCRALIHGGDAFGCEIEMDFDTAAIAGMTAAGSAAPCAVDRELDAPYRLGWTGGTTGKSKAVTLTTRGELAELSAFLTDLVPDLRPGETFLHAAPIAHASGAFFLPALVRGVRSLVMAKFDPAGFVALAERERAGHSFLVPTMLAMLLEEPSLERAKLAFQRICYGASSIAPTLMKRAEARFGRVFAQCYGQAESPMVITCLQPEDHDREGSCGRPFMVVEARIFDDEDNPLGPREVGEIVCRGPQTMAYYWGKPVETANVFRGGWLHTGDVGWMDEDGFFYIVDRKNDLLISGGYNVYPREVEDVLLGFEGVVEAAVVGIPDEKWGDRIEAVVAGRPGIDTVKLRAHATERLAGYKVPRAIQVWPELPKSAANKILRRTVRERLVAESTEENAT